MKSKDEIIVELMQVYLIHNQKLFEIIKHQREIIDLIPDSVDVLLIVEADARLDKIDILYQEASKLAEQSTIFLAGIKEITHDSEPKH